MLMRRVSGRKCESFSQITIRSTLPGAIRSPVRSWSSVVSGHSRSDDRLGGGMPGIPAGRRDLDGGHFKEPCPLIVRRPSSASSSIRAGRRVRSGPDRIDPDARSRRRYPGRSRPAWSAWTDPRRLRSGNLAPEDTAAGVVGSERDRIADLHAGHVAIGDVRDHPHDRASVRP